MVARDVGRGRVLTQHPTQNKKGEWSEPHVGTEFDAREDYKGTEEAKPVAGRSSVQSDDTSGNSGGSKSSGGSKES